MFGPAAQPRLDIGRVQILFGREAVEAAALEIANLIDQNIALCAQFAGIARLAQNARRRIAAAVAEFREGDLDQFQPIQMRDQRACVLIGFEPHRGRVRLVEKGVEGDAGFFAIGLQMLNHRSPP